MRCIRNSGFDDGTLELGKEYETSSPINGWPDLVNLVGFSQFLAFRTNRFKPVVRVPMGRRP